MCIILFCSGHRIGTAEVESALVSHPQCAEAAVVGIEHEVGLLVLVCGFMILWMKVTHVLCAGRWDLFGINALTIVIHDHFILTVQVKGQGIYAFVTLVDGVSYSEELRKSLILTVRKQVSLLFRTLVLTIMACSHTFHSMVL